MKHVHYMLCFCCVFINKCNNKWCFCLLIAELDAYIEENEDKYLNIALTDNNSEALKTYAEVWSQIKHQIKKINDRQLGK